MADEAVTDGSMLLVYLLDELRETSGLLRVADLDRQTRRPWWRNLFFGVVRTKSEVTAGFALQYLGENIDRARDHWREAVRHRHELERSSRADWVSRLGADLDAAGFDGVLPRLAHSAIPHTTAEAARHLGGVVATIRDCDALVTRARNQLTLQKMRSEDG
ncbi:MAG TPA: hypothetical protein VLD86_00600 [Ilumatobacteraceae bacterium]|nr:hypothetical protein [Ilumatobacteraceae bacterium]